MHDTRVLANSSFYRRVTPFAPFIFCTFFAPFTTFHGCTFLEIGSSVVQVGLLSGVVPGGSTETMPTWDFWGKLRRSDPPAGNVSMRQGAGVTGECLVV